MRRSLLAFAVSLAIGVAAVAITVWAALPQPPVWSVVVPSAAGQDVLPVHEQLLLETPRLPASTEAAVTLQVAAVPTPPVPLTLRLLDARDAILATCRWAADSYGPAGELRCGVADPTRVRRLVVSANGVGVYGKLQPGRPPLGGGLQRSVVSHGTWERVRFLRQNLDALRPVLVPGWLALVGSALALALAGTALALVFWPERETPESRA
jgi:hypothetical protein